jgi:hypothetical protein
MASSFVFIDVLWKIAFNQKKKTCSIYDSTNSWRDNVFFNCDCYPRNDGLKEETK